MHHTQMHQELGRLRSIVDELRRDTPFGAVGDRILNEVTQGLDNFARLVADPRVAGQAREQLKLVLHRLEAFGQHVTPELHDRVQSLLGNARIAVAQIAPSLEIPSRPLLGVLPLARVIPQDVHSVFDYTNGLAVAAPVFFADTPQARFASIALGGSIFAVSALTDYRLSLAKVLPIEVHEALDFIWGAAVIASPFVLGYHKKDPLAAVIQIMVGATTILTSLFTDYRAAKGRGRHAIAAATMAGARLQTGVSAHPEYQA